ncbi:MAG: MFS transporter [Nitrospinota bacterium]|nr:MFS transporter [Nitrospinota bacterium]
MYPVIRSVFSLYLVTGILASGNGLLGTIIGIRASEENFSIQVIGLIMGCYFLGFVSGVFIWPGIIRRVGYIRAFAVIATSASIVAILYILVLNPFAWGVLRVLSGFCAVGWHIIIESWLNVESPKSYRGKVLSVYTSISMLSIAVGQFLITFGDISNFENFGLASILLSLSLIPIAMTTLSEPAHISIPKPDIPRMVSSVPLGIAGAIVAGLIGGAFWGMGPVFAYSIKMPPVEVAMFMCVTAIGGGVFQWPIGKLSDRFDRRKLIFFICIFGAFFTVMSYFVLHIWVKALFFLAFFWGGPVFSVYALSIAHVTDYLEPHEVLGATGTMLFANGFGAGIGPVVAGILMQNFGSSALFAMIAFLLVLLGLYSLYRVTRRLPVPPERRAEYIPLVRTSQVALEMDPRANPDGK